MFHHNPCWSDHVDHVLSRGEQRVAACMSWTQPNSQDLLLSVCSQAFNAYVRPSVYFGLEFVAKDSQLQRVNTRLFQLG